MYQSTEARAREISSGATQNLQALRSLNEHAAIELDVRWRDLPDNRWCAPVRTVHGRAVPVSETVWLRAREVWLHTVDLNNGVSMRELPTAVLERLLADITASWRSRGIDDVPRLDVSPSKSALLANRTVVSGSLPEIVAWASGRAMLSRLQSYRGSPRQAPRWI